MFLRWTQTCPPSPYFGCRQGLNYQLSSTKTLYICPKETLIPLPGSLRALFLASTNVLVVSFGIILDLLQHRILRNGAAA